MTLEHRRGCGRDAYRGRGEGLRGCRVLRGRGSECDVLDRFVEKVEAGESRVLLVRGVAGVGKTALLDHAVSRLSVCRAVRTAGVRSEMGLDFAGLHQLCGSMVDRVEQLPGRQRESLEAALGLRGGPAPDRFLVGLGVLGVLGDVARERPLVCVVDDAQWLDRASAQVLGFVARRLTGVGPVGLVVAARAPDELVEFTGLPELVVDGLTGDDARALFAGVLPGPVDERVLDLMVAETRGNPRALLEVSRGVPPVGLVGFGLPDDVVLPQELDVGVREQWGRLGEDTRRLLLIAATDPVGDPVVLWRAAGRLGIGVGAAAAAVEGDLLQIDVQVRFRHPLVRCAVYRAASTSERRGAHAVLADVTDPVSDPERHGWHAAHAVPGPDEAVAVELERLVGRARARGGLVAAAAFLRRAAELTHEAERRAERTLAAVEAVLQVGPPDAALKLLCLAEAGPLTKLQRARVDVLRARVALATRGSEDAASLLLTAAVQLEPLDMRLARETYLDALSAAASATTPAMTVGKVAEIARGVPAAERPPRPADLLLDGLALRFTDGFAAAVPTLKRALAAFDRPDLPDQELRWLRLACATAAHLWDDETWHTLATRHAQLARDTGALITLPVALDSSITQRVLVGELAAAATLLDELNATATTTGNTIVSPGALLLAAWQGHYTHVLELADDTTTRCRPGDESRASAVTGWARALLLNSLGRYGDALAAIAQLGQHPPAMDPSANGLLVEVIEAAARSGTAEYPADALARLAETTSSTGTNWAAGIEARCRALLTTGPVAERHYRIAVAQLARTRLRGELARAHLLYGEWLRRQRRRLDAREQLRTAHTIFTGIGAQAFARRASRELGATGETARKRTVETTSELTPHETHIAHLVHQGLSNPEIAAHLYISRRTVEWHLSRIFNKLDINSRKQLRNHHPRTNPHHPKENA